MCGEHPVSTPLGVMVAGSSPHVRGAPVRQMDDGSGRGIIPACAGSTTYSFCGIVTYWDHPRMCGEHVHSARLVTSAVGSSPHVRGALLDVHFLLLYMGIIPACAGSTSSTQSRAQPPRDHPRMCGEHPSYMSRGRYEVGSSPHVRGARHRLLLMRYRPRDHPRMCGEHLANGLIGVMVRGSSPHVRGALLRSQLCLSVRGIIPACAGSTGRLAAGLVRAGDHPRMCGEHTSKIA